MKKEESIHPAKSSSIVVVESYFFRLDRIDRADKDQLDRLQ